MNDLRLYPITYMGNKYNETKRYLLKIEDYTKYDIISEPFGGIFGFIRAIYKQCRKDTIFIINDLDPKLIKLHNYFKNNEMESIKKDLEEYYKKNKLNEMNDKETRRYIREHKKDDNPEFLFIQFNTMERYRFNQKLTRKISLNIDNLKKYKDFYNRCIFYNMNYKEFINEIESKYKNKSILYFFDPPYFMSDNKEYMKNHNNDDFNNKIIVDNTHMFIDIWKYFKSKKKCIMIINKNAITEHFYNKYKVNEYNKIYQATKRITEHMVIYNGGADASERRTEAPTSDGKNEETPI